MFDCNTTIGRRSVRNPECAYMTRDLISIMESYGIKYALVSHAMCEECGPILGNEILLSEIEGHDRFYPCRVLLPSYTEELDNLRTLIITMVKKGVKAAKIYPKNHYFSLSEWCVGELLSELEEYRMPLLIDFSIIHYHDAIQKIQWNAIYDICKNHKNLPVYWNPLYEERISMWGEGYPFDAPYVSCKVIYKRGLCPEAETIP